MRNIINCTDKFTREKFELKIYKVMNSVCKQENPTNAVRLSNYEYPLVLDRVRDCLPFVHPSTFVYVSGWKLFTVRKSGATLWKRALTTLSAGISFAIRLLVLIRRYRFVQIAKIPIAAIHK